MNEKTKGMLLVLGGAFLFSTAGLWVKLLPWGTFSTAAGKSFFAIPVFLIWMKMQHHKLRFNKTVLLGALANSGMGITFVLSTNLTSAANAVVLQYTNPIFIILFTWLLFRKKPSRIASLTCGIVFCGMILCFADQLTSGGMIGNLIAVASGAFYAIVFMLKTMPEGDFESSLLLSFCIDLLIGGWQIFTETDFSLRTIIILMVFGMLEYALGFILLSVGLDRVSPITAGLFNAIDPLFNPVWVALFYGEMVGIFTMFGAIVIIAAITWYSYEDAKTPAKT